MIQISELRIGNYMQICDLPIEQITLETFKTLELVPATIRAFNGVPTTEEWLLKFGFKLAKPKRGMQKSFKKNNLRINMSNSGNFYHGNKLKSYIHKIQNLYYELEDEELTIK